MSARCFIVAALVAACVLTTTLADENTYTHTVKHFSAKGRVLPQHHTLFADFERAPIDATRVGNITQCKLQWFDQTIDHFSWVNSTATYKQRYFVCSQYWSQRTLHGRTVHGPIFFYTGNEGNVELYVNSTGLMWQNAERFGALLVFAEHRYYGESQPSQTTMQYLTHEQAMADYAVLLASLKQTLQCQESPVIAFGGSYGGMLSCWMRLKYPATITGAVAASAPVLAFHGINPPFNSETYWQVVTRDATAAAGASGHCADNVRNTWDFLFEQGQTQSGRDQLQSTFGLCDALTSMEDVNKLAILQYFAWDTMAMGNYPWPSNYLTSGPLLPAWPMRAACTQLSEPLTGWDLLKAHRKATDLFNNATKTAKCYNLPTDIEEDGIWDYQWCTEMLPQESYFATDGVNDMFWARPYNMTFINDRCQRKFNLKPRPDWIANSYGGYDMAKYGSNIVFSNGEYDPWSSGGVKASLSESLPAIFIAEGAHHLDLMFSHPDDPASVTEARETEMAHVQTWIEQAYASL